MIGPDQPTSQAMSKPSLPASEQPQTHERAVPGPARAEAVSLSVEKIVAVARQIANELATSASQIKADLERPFELGSPMRADISDVAKAYQNMVNPAFALFIAQINQIPVQVRESVLVLGQHGWYLDPRLALASLWEVAAEFETGEAGHANAVMAGYFAMRLGEIEESLIQRVPARAKLIRSAFGAHRRGEFDLSIPVLLAQADGICIDATEKSFFRAKDGSPATAPYVREIAGRELLTAMLAALAEPLPINANESRRRKVSDWTALNRHMVLHGESLDYGTERNSLKAISLLNYVASVLVEGAASSSPPSDANR